VSGSPAAGEESHRDLGFRVVSEDGAWRIADPPDAMIVPQSHFGARYRQYSLYFFDASGSVLVPEPVYLPTGPQAATMLVNGLRDGAGTNRKGVERSFVPRGSPVGAVIGVRADGVADVPLPAAVKRLDPADLERALAQVAWTLRQIDDIARFRVMVAGHPMTLPTGKTTADVNGWGEYSPAIGPASTDLFGLRDDHVVQLVGGSELQAVSWRGSAVTDPRSLGVDMTGQHFGLVSEDGSLVYLLNRSGPAEGRVIEAYAGTDVLRPMWDWTDRMWLVDRTYEGTRVVLVNRGRSRTVPAPGLGDVRLRAAAMSRDGTRMAVVTAPRAGGMSELLMLRVVRRRDGVPVRLTAPRVIRMSTPLQRVRDVGWRDPVTVAVLTRPSPRTSQVVLAACDGSSAAVPSSAAVDVLFDEGVSLAASPGGPVALMVATADGSLHALNAQGRWDFDVAPRDLGSPTFVG
jgi:hypothetical protein